jgi:hypothetical protein
VRFLDGAPSFAQVLQKCEYVQFVNHGRRVLLINNVVL